jgi:hypothetical protein
MRIGIPRYVRKHAAGQNSEVKMVRYGFAESCITEVSSKNVFQPPSVHPRLPVLADLSSFLFGLHARLREDLATYCAVFRQGDDERE